MKKTRFKIDVFKHGPENGVILSMVASHNSGVQLVSIPDFISMGVIERAKYPIGSKGFDIYRTDEDENKLAVSYDNRESVAMTIEEIEVNELEPQIEIVLSGQQSPSVFK